MNYHTNWLDWTGLKVQSNQSPLDTLPKQPSPVDSSGTGSYNLIWLEISIYSRGHLYNYDFCSACWLRSHDQVTHPQNAINTLFFHLHLLCKKYLEPRASVNLRLVQESPGLPRLFPGISRVYYKTHRLTQDALGSRYFLQSHHHLFHLNCSLLTCQDMSPIPNNTPRRVMTCQRLPT